MVRKFASIKHAATHGYTYDIDSYEFNATVSDHFRMFETYGDGLIQHSHDWPITREYLTDYLVSLSVALLADNELANTVRFTLSAGPSIEQIDFAASVVFKSATNLSGELTGYEKTTRYYSMQERKVTSSESKRYDKRYEKVTASEDGSADAIYRMTLPSYARDLERLEWACAIHRWAMACTDDKRPYMALPACFLNWTKDNDEARAMRDALECAQNVCQSVYLRDLAGNQIANYTRFVEQSKATASAEAESAA